MALDTRRRVASTATFALLVGASVVPVGACSSSPEAVAIGDDDASTDASTDTTASEASDTDVVTLIPPDASDAHADGSPTDGSMMESGVDCDSGAALICGGQCVDPSSPANCGSCTNVCPTTADGTATCAKDDCGAYACGQMCGTGYHQCGASCLPNSDDPSVTTDTCIVSETFGIFVSTATGADSTTCGTRAAPCKTIGNGITVAHATSGKRVYVCDDGTYAEQIALTSAVDGAAVYGGFSCTGGTWAYDATKKPLVMLASPTGAASCATCALTATGLTTGAKFEDMAFQAPNGVNPGDSSIAVFANGSTGTLTLLRSSVTAGNGGGWTMAADTGSNYSGATAQDGFGPRGTPLTNGGLKGTATCSNGTASAGGNGGDGNAASDNGGNGGWSPAGTTMPALGYDGLGGTGAPSMCTGGDSGANGAGGTAGAAPTHSGALDGNGWHPLGGAAGTNGDPGQGGGGGGGKTAGTGIGGGGAGGCGGGSGGGGSGGGSSIAVLSLASSVSLGMCTLATGSGGSGEAGGAGESGQGGGAYALPTTVPAFCEGNFGGNGGGGGGGGGGAGGLSVGIVYSATAPTTTGIAFTPGTLGAGGAGGSAGPSGTNGAGNPGNSGAAGNAGPAGIAQQTLVLP